MTNEHEHCWVCGEGPIPADWMILGEAPGPDECRRLRPFIGQAGQFLRRALKDLGADADEIRISNIAKSFPGYNPQSEINPPSATQIQRELPFLIDEIPKVQPKCILALGVTAINELTGKRTVQAARAAQVNGFLSLLPKFGHSTSVVPTWHPAFIRGGRGQTHQQDWLDDIKRFLDGCDPRE
jgi:DNA polymerase